MATADFELLSELCKLSARAASASPSTEKSIGKVELENRIAFFAFVLSRIQRDCEAWSEAVHAKCLEFDWERSRQFSDRFKSWLQSVEPTISKLPAFAQTYGDLEGADQLVAGYRDVQLMSLDADRVQRFAGSRTRSLV